jgi:O-antigen/teichoic acid export membrane protein
LTISGTQRRNRLLSLAVGSSLLSKLMTAGVQVLALPLAASALGAHGFALYAMLSAATGWLSLANLGIAPTLMVKLARLHASGEHGEESVAFSTAFWLTLTITATVATAVLLIVWMTPVQLLFGATYARDAALVRAGLTLLTIFFFVQTNIAIFEAAQAAHQQQHVLNLVSASSGIPCLLAVFAVSRTDATPVTLILAMSLPALLMRTVNAAVLLARNRHLRPRASYVRRSACSDLAGKGVTFALAGTAGNFLAHVFPVLIVGRSLSSEAAAAFAATMQLIVLASGVTSMLATPLWPAIADSIARKETEWAKAAYRKFLGVGLSASALIAAVIGVAGSWIFEHWFRGHISPAEALLCASAAYLIASTWEVVHFTVLVGLERVTEASFLVVARDILGAAVTVLLVPRTNEAVPFLIMTAAIVVVDLVPMRRLTIKYLGAPSYPAIPQTT